MISTIPNAIFTRYRGLVGDREEVQPLNVNLHDAMLALMQGALAPTYSVVAENIDASGFGPEDFDTGFAGLKDAVRRQIDPRKYDIVVVSAPISPKGTAASLGHEPNLYEIEFSYILVALDGASFDVSGIAYSGRPYYIDIPTLFGSFSWDGGPISTLTEADKQALTNGLKQLMQRNVPRSLGALGLTVRQPGI